MHRRIKNHNKHNTKFVYKVENPSYQSKVKTTPEKPNPKNHYMKIQFTG
jgi:hypothetical protein